MTEKTQEKAAKATAKQKQASAKDSMDIALERLRKLDGLSLTDALTLAQSEMVNPPMKGENSFYKKPDGSATKYATLDDILNIVRCACNRWGILFTQTLDYSSDGETVYETSTDEMTNKTLTPLEPAEMLCTVVSKGEEVRVLAETPLPSYKDVKTRGSDLTYLKRQQATSAFGLAGQDDTAEHTPSKEPVGAGDSHYDRDLALQREYALKTDKLDELKDRLKVAKSLGVEEKDISEWTKENIGLPTANMTLNQLDSTIEYINALISSYEPEQEEIDF